MPAWAKSKRLCGSLARPPGFVEFIGDVPYDEATPRQKIIYKDFPIADDTIRLKSQSVREAVGVYIPPDLFERWLRVFVRTLDVTAHKSALFDALNNIAEQFNLSRPWVSARPEVVRKNLERGANVGRFVLGMSDLRFEASKYPEVLFAMGLCQAAYQPFLGNLRGSLWGAALDGRLASDKLARADSVIDLLAEQFGGFVIFVTLLPLALLERQALVRDNPGQPEAVIMPVAIGRAWDIFIRKHMLRRDFAGGGRMICPANQHLRAMKQRQWIERVYGFVLQHTETQPVAHWLEETRRIAESATRNQEYYFWHHLGLRIEANRSARGGQGLILRKEVALVSSP